MLKKYMQLQKGQILVLTVILLPLLLIMTIFIIEVGFLYIKQTQLQHAADAIAIAGISDDVDKAKELIEKNRTVDLHIDSVEIAFSPQITLTEPVKPIFYLIFGDNEIITLEVYSSP